MKKDNKRSGVLKAFRKYGFELVSEREHLKLRNSAGVGLSLPNHKLIKGSTICKELARLNINKQEFFQNI